MKTLFIVFIAMAMACAVSGQCTFDPIDACNRCNFSRSYVQYVANPCNCTEYYSCEKVRTVITPHKQACLSPCLCFSNDTWGCTIRVTPPAGQSCPTEAPITEVYRSDVDSCYLSGNGPAGPYSQQYKAHTSDPTSYYWIISGLPISMHCPPGTYFNFSICKCVMCVPGMPCSLGSSKQFCLDFENDGAEKGIYYNQEQTCKVVSGAGVSGTNGLELDGAPCNVEIPFFQKNEFRAFTFCGYFKRNSAQGGNGVQGLVFNGGSPQGDCYPGSIKIISINNTHISGGIITQTGTYDILHSNAAAPDVFHKVCLRYDGKSLDLSVDGVIQSILATGVTEKNGCNLLLGESFDILDIPYFFQGILDNWCFYNTAVDPLP